MNLWIQRSCVQPNLQSCPVVRCVLQLQFSTFLTPELFNLKKAHHVSSESEHLRNSDKFFLSSSGIRAWLVLVPKGCKSSKPDKVPRSVSTHTKTLEAFQVSTTIWQKKTVDTESFTIILKSLLANQRKPSELRLVGFSIWTELQK